VFEIVLERVAEKDLRRLSDEVHDRVVEGISTLATNPRPPGAKKLSGSAGNWRIRVGDYRVLYEIADAVRVVRVYRVRHRPDAYR
jgi:mRNA interferase RelE/StbE